MTNIIEKYVFFLENSINFKHVPHLFFLSDLFQSIEVTVGKYQVKLELHVFSPIGRTITLMQSTRGILDAPFR